MVNGENFEAVDEWSMVVVYAAKSGEIVHTHECMSLRGGNHPDEKSLEKDALEQASRAGRDITKVSLLRVDPKNLKVGVHYKVDTKKRVLVEVPQPKHKAKRA